MALFSFQGACERPNNRLSLLDPPHNMSTRFFRNGLTTGMTGSNIDPDLAASLAVADRRERRERLDRDSSGSSQPTGFSTLLFGQSAWKRAVRQDAGTRGGWRGRLKETLRRLAVK